MSEIPELQERGEPEEKELLPFFPNYILDEVIAWYFMLAVLIVLASMFPAGLEEKADALKTPPHIKPEWYFLSLYQALKEVPRIVGVMAPLVGVVVLFFLPFIDRNPEVAPRKRPLAITLALIVLIAVVVLTAWGWVS
jgi:quinol-cytochrome oxidoreductase complex cytochrome b subunit